MSILKKIVLILLILRSSIMEFNFVLSSSKLLYLNENKLMSRFLYLES